MRKDFISFQADDTLEHIVNKFAETNTTSAPVFDGKEFIGVVSDIEIVKYFTPKKFLFLWKKHKQKPMTEIKKATAGALIRKPGLVLKPKQNLNMVLKKIVRWVTCIPVMDKGKVVGIVRGKDMVNFFLKELAKDEYSKELDDAKEEAGSALDTTIDKILERVRKEKEVSCKQMARELGISVKTTEKLCECLNQHHLVQLKYSFFKGAIVRRLEHEK